MCVCLVCVKLEKESLEGEDLEEKEIGASRVWESTLSRLSSSRGTQIVILLVNLFYWLSFRVSCGT